ncbi:hypothetical protein N7465_009208 [Penicillium sp. CMV-2018d]|nr:hypothetical protein N7465_009208 [Penicillium sp. CMV-2018d]
MQMKDYYDRRHQPKHFEAGDKVLLRIGRGYKIPVNDAISRKLGQQYAGLFTVGRDVQHLEPAPSPDPFDRELPQDPEPTYDERFPDDPDRHDVAAVLDMRVRHLGRYRTPVKEYLIQWEGEPREQSQWAKERNAAGKTGLPEDGALQRFTSGTWVVLKPEGFSPIEDSFLAVVNGVGSALKALPEPDLSGPKHVEIRKKL